MMASARVSSNAVEMVMCAVSTATAMAEDEAEFDDENMCPPGALVFLLILRQ